MKKTVFLYSVGLAFLLLPSCQNNGTGVLNDESALVGADAPAVASLDETQLDETLESVDLLVEEAITNNVSLARAASTDSNQYLTDCPVITVDKNVVPQVMTIDFGTSCTGKDGKVRSGKIIITATSFKTFPSVRQKTFENFIVDGRRMEGNVTKTIRRDSSNTIQTATLKENLRVINIAKGDTLTRLTDITRQYKKNVLADKTDDQTLTWGTAVNTQSNGVVVTKTIDESTPLLFEASCKHIVSGIASFENSKGRKWSIDYGNGTCDNTAILTVNGKSKEITIH
ncbi:MAG TPA: hypothetical protein VFP20_05490 [Bacteroidales bacterium]|nr:hypothetical protein [Bacteroidales bacterium]